MAYEAGAAHGVAAFCALLGALFIQIGTNFANDYFDFVKGTDTEDRVGPTRATAAGLVTPAAMRNATILAFTLTLLPGAYIIWRGDWPFAVIGALSILFGVLYTGGPYPLGYLGLGDILVLIFFGPVAVGGTYYLQTLELNSMVLVAGLAPGFISVALLTVNNLRDVDGDRKAGKRTLAVRFGKTFAKFEYIVSILIACVVVPLYLYAVANKILMAMVAIVSMYLAVYGLRLVCTYKDPPALNTALARTGALLLIFSVLFCIGWIR
jgi:1,4-dihydroxy-2-naphthoate octaprenyltransferase